MIKTCALQVETSVNPSEKQPHITILEMDTSLGSTQIQSIWGCSTLRHIITPLIGSRKIICTHEGHV